MRYIDADNLPRHGNRGGVVYWRDIEAQPTADVVEVVRCKDCKHWINDHLCESLSRFGSFETRADFYCGFAERRTDG